MSEEYLTVKDYGSIYYRRSGSGPVVVLLHGFPYDGSLWDAIVPELSESYTVVVPDLPGAGRSELSNPDQSIADLAEGIAALIREVSPDKPVTVAGHSMGGYVAVALAELHPQLLSGLSLVHSAVTADTEDKKAQRRKAVALIEKGGLDEFIKALVPGLFSEYTAAHKKHLLQETAVQARKLPAESAASFYNAMMQRPDRSGVIKELACPVQWILGRDDKIIPLQTTLQQAVLSDTNFVIVINECAHMCMLEAPEQLSAALRTFLAICVTPKKENLQPA